MVLVSNSSTFSMQLLIFSPTHVYCSITVSSLLHHQFFLLHWINFFSTQHPIIYQILGHLKTWPHSHFQLLLHFSLFVVTKACQEVLHFFSVLNLSSPISLLKTIPSDFHPHWPTKSAFVKVSKDEIWCFDLVINAQLALSWSINSTWHREVRKKKSNTNTNWWLKRLKHPFLLETFSSPAFQNIPLSYSFCFVLFS